MTDGEQSNIVTHRVASVDLLRGTVMIIMALDHVRDFIHRGAMNNSPTDLATTTPILFMTRWITHICAPAFALTAGLGAWFWWQKGRSRAELSRFLASRGIWLMLLEVTVMRLGYYFNLSLEYPVFLLVFWSLGLSMVALAALVWLPMRLLTVLSVVTMLFHPLLDGLDLSGWLWNVVHQVGAFQAGRVTVITPYPLIPWVAVMAFGFSLGPLFRLDPVERRRRLVWLGSAAVVGFVVLRAINGWGDPVPWSSQQSPAFTALSFLNTSKYPASPSFLLMTLGPALLLLAAFDRAKSGRNSPALIFGRVPLFYYMVHFFLAHVIATLLALAHYGSTALDFIFRPYPSLGGAAEAFPAGFGYSLGIAYLVWLLVLLVSYPLCRWYAGVKARRDDWWLKYL
ncbi:MAG TPA: heparan-alpha-glucosaminide N-acetyltransferase domain-containing protein [Gemmatimonadales bacterium]|nr:heparan-alpha-glucosaminide N-acetyltransferase domain-containing protein [Gemmatimonadales bacterium]